MATLQALMFVALVILPLWIALWFLARGMSQAFEMIEDIYRRLLRDEQERGKTNGEDSE